MSHIPIMCKHTSPIKMTPDSLEGGKKVDLLGVPEE